MNKGSPSPAASEDTFIFPDHSPGYKRMIQMLIQMHLRQDFSYTEEFLRSIPMLTPLSTALNVSNQLKCNHPGKYRSQAIYPILPFIYSHHYIKLHGLQQPGKKPSRLLYIIPARRLNPYTVPDPEGPLTQPPPPTSLAKPLSKPLFKPLPSAVASVETPRSQRSTKKG
jgi:hypothetical protein